MRGKKTIVLFFVLFAILGCAILFSGILGIERGGAIKGWPTTDGIVTDSYVQSVHHGGRSPYTSHSPMLTYDYIVNGDSYRSTKHAPSHGTDSLASAEAILEEYPVGTTVLVHYDPGNPADSVLETAIDADTMAAPFIGGSLILLGVIGGIWAYRSKSDFSPFEQFTKNKGAPKRAANPYNIGATWQPCMDLNPQWDEKVLWRGKPLKPSYLLSRDRNSVAFLMVFLFMAIALVFAGLLGDIFAFVGVGGIFLVIALGSFAVLLVKQLKTYPGTEYLLTDKRLLSKTGGIEGNCWSIDLRNIYRVMISRTFFEDVYKTGSLVFSDTNGVDFAAIINPEEVARRIEEVAKEKRRAEISLSAY